MRSVRVLRSIAAAWLACQFAAVCVASVALCCAVATPVETHQMKCCAEGAPGKACPMHRSKGGAPAPLMRSACDPDDAALVALVSGVGILPHLSISHVTLQSLEPVSAPTPSAIGRADRPDAPPPKA